jgi:hypothetical protein
MEQELLRVPGWGDRDQSAGDSLGPALPSVEMGGLPGWILIW